MPKPENLIPFQFKKGEVANPTGRPPNIVTLMKKIGYSKTDIDNTIKSMLSMTLKELAEVYQHTESTILEKTIANALKKSLEKGSLYSIETLISRVQGLPTQSVNATVTEKPIFVAINLDVIEDHRAIENQ